jgi:DNA gyrase subunit B
LRGKILNVERARLKKVLDFKEIKALVVALGTAVAEEFDLKKLRYHKIILAADRDVDGEHIVTLLLTLFFRHFPLIIEAGHLYIAQAPLYKMTRGAQMEYAYSESEKDEVIKKFKNQDNLDIQRYKGLGEMNSEELWETTMDPETRVLKQVTIEDAKIADEMFDKLMGPEVPPRRRFIQTHALEVANLDI